MRKKPLSLLNQRNEETNRYLAAQYSHTEYLNMDKVLKEEKIKYYKGEGTIYSDNVFDQLMIIQEYIEELHPEWKLDNTVTEMVGYKEILEEK